VNLLPTAEQQQIRDAVVAFVEAELPANRLHDPAKTLAAAERQTWRQLAALGWLGLGVAEEFGGVGYGPAEDILLFRECGRQLVSPIVLAGRLGAEVAARTGEATLAAQLMSGEKSVSIANVVGAERVVPGRGTRLQLFDSEPGDMIVAWTTAGMGLFDWADVGANPVEPGIDHTIRVMSAEVLSPRPGVWCPAGQSPLPKLATILVAAMLAGIAEATRDRAVAYACLREQFGKPIGSFQAIQHFCANMAISAETAWAQTVVAALSWGARAKDFPFHVAAAQVLASDAALDNSRTCIQIHGGMGFSAECDAHLFLKRSHALGVLCGSARRVWPTLIGRPEGLVEVEAV